MNKIINCTADGEDVVLPQYETEKASGMDLRAWKYSLPSDLKNTQDFKEGGFTLMPHERVLIKTGLHIELDEDIEAQIRGRSGLALKHGIVVAQGVGTVDEDYRGDVGVILLNTSNEPFIIKKDDRIAQIVFAEVKKRKLKLADTLNNTKRGEGGFNSTGTR